MEKADRASNRLADASVDPVALFHQGRLEEALARIDTISKRPISPAMTRIT